MREVLSSIIFLGVVGGILWGFGVWQKQHTESQNTQPSIGNLPSELVSSPTAQTEISTPIVSLPKTETTMTSIPIKIPKDMLDIKVLNGGAAKGSAAKVQAILKKSGYSKALASTAKGDFTGTVVYYTSNHSTDATDIQQALLKDIPKAEIKPAPSTLSEEGSASVVVMLGK
jgi:hypothetical protein